MISNNGADVVVIRVDPIRRQWWKESMTKLLPEYRVVLWDEDTYDDNAVLAAIVWNPPLGGLGRFPNLRCVASVGAGVSHILKDPTYPRSVPIIRTVSESLRRRMTEYVVLHVLRIHRRLPEAEKASQEGRWEEFIEPLASEFTVGILGVGNLGRAAAEGLQAIGYSLIGWTRRGRPVPKMEIVSGQDGLSELLHKCRVVVSMLPLTPETDGLLNADFFGRMKPGASLINVGRGEHVVDKDLLSALDNGPLASATLDVFREEPLPEDSPLWTHSHILITCHTASAIEPKIGGQVIADNLHAFLAGKDIQDVVDIEQGY